MATFAAPEDLYQLNALPDDLPCLHLAGLPRDNYIWFALAWAVGLGFLFLKYKHALFTATEKIKAKLNRSAK